MQSEQFVIFKLAGEEYAICARDIQEINRLNEIPINIMPKVPSFIKGIINLRGDVVPIIDLKKKFEIKKETDCEETKNRIIILRIESHMIGILVDSIMGVTELCLSDMSLPDEAMLENTDYISSLVHIGSRLIFVLDTKKIAV